eukprot:gene12239-8425_t
MLVDAACEVLLYSHCGKRNRRSAALLVAFGFTVTRSRSQGPSQGLIVFFSPFHIITGKKKKKKEEEEERNERSEEKRTFLNSIHNHHHQQQVEDKLTPLELFCSEEPQKEKAEGYCFFRASESEKRKKERKNRHNNTYRSRCCCGLPLLISLIGPTIRWGESFTSKGEAGLRREKKRKAFIISNLQLQPLPHPSLNLSSVAGMSSPSSTLDATGPRPSPYTNPAAAAAAMPPASTAVSASRWAMPVTEAVAAPPAPHTAAAGTPRPAITHVATARHTARPPPFSPSSASSTTPTSSSSSPHGSPSSTRIAPPRPTPLQRFTTQRAAPRLGASSGTAAAMRWLSAAALLSNHSDTIDAIHAQQRTEGKEYPIKVAKREAAATRSGEEIRNSAPPRRASGRPSPRQRVVWFPPEPKEDRSSAPSTHAEPKDTEHQRKRCGEAAEEEWRNTTTLCRTADNAAVHGEAELYGREEETASSSASAPPLIQQLGLDADGITYEMLCAAGVSPVHRQDHIVYRQRTQPAAEERREKKKKNTIELSATTSASQGLSSSSAPREVQADAGGAGSCRQNGDVDAVVEVADHVRLCHVIPVLPRRFPKWCLMQQIIPTIVYHPPSTAPNPRDDHHRPRQDRHTAHRDVLLRLLRGAQRQHLFQHLCPHAADGRFQFLVVSRPPQRPRRGRPGDWEALQHCRRSAFRAFYRRLAFLVVPPFSFAPQSVAGAEDEEEEEQGGAAGRTGDGAHSAASPDLVVLARSLLGACLLARRRVEHDAAEALDSSRGEEGSPAGGSEIGEAKVEAPGGRLDPPTPHRVDGGVEDLHGNVLRIVLSQHSAISSRWKAAGGTRTVQELAAHLAIWRRTTARYSCSRGTSTATRSPDAFHHASERLYSEEEEEEEEDEIRWMEDSGDRVLMDAHLSFLLRRFCDAYEYVSAAHEENADPTPAEGKPRPHQSFRAEDEEMGEEDQETPSHQRNTKPGRLPSQPLAAPPRPPHLPGACSPHLRQQSAFTSPTSALVEWDSGEVDITMDTEGLPDEQRVRLERTYYLPPTSSRMPVKEGGEATLITSLGRHDAPPRRLEHAVQLQLRRLSHFYAERRDYLHRHAQLEKTSSQPHSYPHQQEEEVNTGEERREYRCGWNNICPTSRLLGGRERADRRQQTAAAAPTDPPPPALLNYPCACIHCGRWVPRFAQFSQTRNACDDPLMQYLDLLHTAATVPRGAGGSEEFIPTCGKTSALLRMMRHKELLEYARSDAADIGGGEEEEVERANNGIRPMDVRTADGSDGNEDTGGEARGKFSPAAGHTRVWSSPSPAVGAGAAARLDPGRFFAPVGAMKEALLSSPRYQEAYRAAEAARETAVAHEMWRCLQQRRRGAGTPSEYAPATPPPEEDAEGYPVPPRGVTDDTTEERKSTAKGKGPGDGHTAGAGQDLVDAVMRRVHDDLLDEIVVIALERTRPNTPQQTILCPPSEASAHLLSQELEEVLLLYKHVIFQPTTEHISGANAGAVDGEVEAAFRASNFSFFCEVFVGTVGLYYQRHQGGLTLRQQEIIAAMAQRVLNAPPPQQHSQQQQPTAGRGAKRPRDSHPREAHHHHHHHHHENTLPRGTHINHRSRRQCTILYRRYTCAALLHLVPAVERVQHRVLDLMLSAITHILHQRTLIAYHLIRSALPHPHGVSFTAGDGRHSAHGAHHAAASDATSSEPRRHDASTARPPEIPISPPLSPSSPSSSSHGSGGGLPGAVTKHEAARYADWYTAHPGPGGVLQLLLKTSMWGTALVRQMHIWCGTATEEEEAEEEEEAGGEDEGDQNESSRNNSPLSRIHSRRRKKERREPARQANPTSSTTTTTTTTTTTRYTSLPSMRVPHYHGGITAAPPFFTAFLPRLASWLHGSGDSTPQPLLSLRFPTSDDAASASAAPQSPKGETTHVAPAHRTSPLSSLSNEESSLESTRSPASRPTAARQATGGAHSDIEDGNEERANDRREGSDELQGEMVKDEPTEEKDAMEPDWSPVDELEASVWAEAREWRRPSSPRRRRQRSSSSAHASENANAATATRFYQPLYQVCHHTCVPCYLPPPPIAPRRGRRRAAALRGRGRRRGLVARVRDAAAGRPNSDLVGARPLHFLLRLEEWRQWRGWRGRQWWGRGEWQKEAWEEDQKQRCTSTPARAARTTAERRGPSVQGVDVDIRRRECSTKRREEAGGGGLFPLVAAVHNPAPRIRPPSCVSSLPFTPVDLSTDILSGFDTKYVTSFTLPSSFFLNIKKKTPYIIIIIIVTYIPNKSLNIFKEAAASYLSTRSSFRALHHITFNNNNNNTNNNIIIIFSLQSRTPYTSSAAATLLSAPNNTAEAEEGVSTNNNNNNNNNNKNEQTNKTTTTNNTGNFFFSFRLLNIYIFFYFSVDQHFRTLGLARGSSEEEVKRAYRAKALELHPDRNPNGAEGFKRVNQAYEALQLHYKTNGGHDTVRVRTPRTFGRPTGTGFRAARNQNFFQSRGESSGSANGVSSEDGDPKFTDEQLFGEVPGGWTSAGSKMPNPKSTDGAPIFNTGYSRTSPQYNSSDSRWRQAHGDRVPVSGYSAARSGATSEGSQGVPSYRKDEPAFKVAPFASIPRTFEELKFMFEQLYTKTEYVRQRFTDGTIGRPSASDREAFELEKEKKMRQVWDRVSKLNSEEEKRGVLRMEWEGVETELEARMDAARHIAQLRERQKQQEEERRHAMAEERRRLQAVEEAARHVREERSRKAKEMAEEMQTALRREKDEEHQDMLLEDKRGLLKMMFRLQYTPDPADVGAMSDIEVYTLTELMEDINNKMKGVQEARLKKGKCSRCRCSHAVICRECSKGAKQCPLCGSRRLDAEKEAGTTSRPPPPSAESVASRLHTPRSEPASARAPTAPGSKLGTPRPEPSTTPAPPINSSSSSAHANASGNTTASSSGVSASTPGPSSSGADASPTTSKPFPGFAPAASASAMAKAAKTLTSPSLRPKSGLLSTSTSMSLSASATSLPNKNKQEELREERNNSNPPLVLRRIVPPNSISLKSTSTSRETYTENLLYLTGTVDFAT